MGPPRRNARGKACGIRSLPRLVPFADTRAFFAGDVRHRIHLLDHTTAGRDLQKEMRAEKRETVVINVVGAVHPSSLKAHVSTSIWTIDAVAEGVSALPSRMKIAAWRRADVMPGVHRGRRRDTALGLLGPLINA